MYTLQRTALGAVLFLLVLSASAADPHDTAGAMPSEYVEQINASWPARSNSYDRPPVLLKAYRPRYPISRALTGTSGECIVVAEISESGGAKALWIEKNDDEKMCDHAVIALRHWQYEPAQKGGHPVAVKVRLAFSFETK